MYLVTGMTMFNERRVYTPMVVCIWGWWGRGGRLDRLRGRIEEGGSGDDERGEIDEGSDDD